MEFGDLPAYGQSQANSPQIAAGILCREVGIENTLQVFGGDDGALVANGKSNGSGRCGQADDHLGPVIGCINGIVNQVRGEAAEQDRISVKSILCIAMDP